MNDFLKYNVEDFAKYIYENGYSKDEFLNKFIKHQYSPEQIKSIKKKLIMPLKELANH